MKEETSEEVRFISIDQIRILNPRARDRKKFETVVQSIRNLGLKKPIQVSVRGKQENGDDGYDLVCGQGRIEAYLALGFKQIPAVVVEISREDRLLRSLAENMARGLPSPGELMHEIQRLKEAGHTNAQIGEKLDMAETTIAGLVVLNRSGEDRLLDAALRGAVPLGVAVEIAKAEDINAQRELLKAYESKELTIRAIRTIKRLIDQRQYLGKSLSRASSKPQKSADSLINAYRKETQRQKAMVRKAQLCEAKLVFIVQAFRKLTADCNFINLLRAEGLDTMPRFLAEALATNQGRQND